MAKRQARTTQKEYEEILNFVDKNKVVLNGKTKPLEANKVNRLWQEFTNAINSKGLGPPRPVDKWRKIFNEWKVNTRRKSREIQVSHTGTGGGPPIKKELNELEERLLSLISYIHLGDDAIADTLGGIEPEFHNLNDEYSSQLTNMEPSYYETIVEASDYGTQGDTEDDTFCYIAATPKLSQEDDPTSKTSAGTKRKLSFSCSASTSLQPELNKNQKTLSTNTILESASISSALSQQSVPKNQRAPSQQQRYTNTILESACTTFHEAQKTKLEASLNQAKAIECLAQAVEKSNKLKAEELKLKEEELKIMKMLAKAKYKKAFTSLEGFEL